jgi:chemotaxis response regulator CheB
MMSEPIRVVVADDHPLFREGVITSLNAVHDIDVIGQAQDAEEVVRIVGEELPDVALLDVTMPGGGIDAARKIAAVCPATRIVMLTVSEDEGWRVRLRSEGRLGARIGGGRPLRQRRGGVRGSSPGLWSAARDVQATPQRPAGRTQQP